MLACSPNGTKGILSKDLATSLLSLLSAKELSSYMNIRDLDEATSISNYDTLVIGTAEGNRKIPLTYGFYNLLDATLSVVDRKTIWRGNYLGNAVSQAQWDSIWNGSFKGLFVGDYWTIGGINWRIADFNYWYGVGDSPVIANHVNIMPDTILYETKWADTDTTVGGYLGSKIFTEGLNNARSIARGAFGEDHIIVRRGLFTNAVTNGCPSSVVYVNTDIEIPNEIMIFGCYISTAVNDGDSISRVMTDGMSQLSMMKINKNAIPPAAAQNYWLRDIAGNNYICIYDSRGRESYGLPSTPYGVRPVFGIAA